MDRETALIEAVLYMETEPVGAAELGQITGLGEDAVGLALSELRARAALPSSGIDLTESSAGFMLAPKQEFWDVLRDRYGRRNEKKLSKAALETLTIIAYTQPVTRAEIEAIRGVSADNMIRLLVERGLVRETGRKDVPGKPAQYGTTKVFLDFFHLSSIADLPKLAADDAERFELTPD